MFGRTTFLASTIAGVLTLGLTAAQAETLRFWTTEEQPERLAKQEEMAAAFKEKTGIEVDVIPVTESDLGTRATAAFAAGDLPDVIYHTLQYALPWAEAGILDTEAATEVFEKLGAGTFAPGAVAMAAVEDGVASVPVDGAKASPPGDLFWKQSRELYFAGKAAMIIWSPFILDELAGLRDSAPPTITDDPTSTELASKTGVVTTLSGPSNPDGAAWADIRYFGITNDADTEAAMQFVEFSMDDGYLSTLSIAPEGKFPIRRGSADNATEFVDGWAKLPVGVDRKAPLTDLYDADTIKTIVSGLDTASRWGVKEGQLSLASKMINSQVMNRLVREYIDDERDAAATVAKLNEELAKIQ